MVDFTMILEDDLAKELCNFKNNKPCDNEIVKRILHYYKPPILLSGKYMELYYQNYDAEILSQLFGKGDYSPNSSLEELSNKTLYKVILSQNKNNFPYVNIFNDRMENNLTATFNKNEERTKAKEHFKALFCNAKTIFIYDNHLCDNQGSFKKFAEECFPKQKLSIFYPPSSCIPKKIRTNFISAIKILCAELKKICEDWNIKENLDGEINNSYNELHDRYIIVDRKIQIILTSGIDYLIDTSKDFTYIIRKLGG
ncbi:hypothetical protein [Helicobacter rodentium]|uniref:hypothetical protein n=1 Tax=Helicobacter rodentium TaxID=59617 RepID=UPI0023F441DD|nr:hypothetical protein [Helicobacter rodentium]